jgi:hypothetical protein
MNNLEHRTAEALPVFSLWGSDWGSGIRSFHAILPFGANPARTAAIWQIVSGADERLKTPAGNISRPIFRGRGVEAATEIKAAIGNYPNLDPNLAAWTRRIEAVPGYDHAYPPHWR